MKEQTYYTSTIGVEVKNLDHAKIYLEGLRANAMVDNIVIKDNSGYRFIECDSIDKALSEMSKIPLLRIAFSFPITVSCRASNPVEENPVSND